MVATSEEIGEIVGEWHRSTRIGGAIFTSDRKYRVEAGRFDGKFLRRQSIRQMLLMLLDCESTLPRRTRIFSYLFHGVRPTSDELLYSKKEEGGGETEKSNDWILALSLSLSLVKSNFYSYRYHHHQLVQSFSLPSVQDWWESRRSLKVEDCQPSEDRPGGELGSYRISKFWKFRVARKVHSKT